MRCLSVILGLERMVRRMARQLARGMGSFFQAHPLICFRDALGKQREDSGYGTQDDAMERLTQLCAEKKTTAPSAAAARRELGQQTVEEYAKQWRPRQWKMTEYSTGLPSAGSTLPRPSSGERGHQRARPLGGEPPHLSRTDR
jgi:hypothetical protein